MKSSVRNCKHSLLYYFSIVFLVYGFFFFTSKAECFALVTNTYISCHLNLVCSDYRQGRESREILYSLQMHSMPVILDDSGGHCQSKIEGENKRTEQTIQHSSVCRVRRRDSYHIFCLLSMGFTTKLIAP